jgi:hypothetical protein
MIRQGLFKIARFQEGVACGYVDLRLPPSIVPVRLIPFDSGKSKRLIQYLSSHACSSEGSMRAGRVNIVKRLRRLALIPCPQS